MKRILYVEANEDGTVGGSHKVLFDLVTRLSNAFEPVVLFYQDNIWAERLRNRGVRVQTWDDVRARERRGLKQGGKASTVGALLAGIARRRRYLRDQAIHLVHLNNSPYIGFDDWLPACFLSRRPCVTYGAGDLRLEKNPIRRRIIRNYDAYFPASRLIRDAYLRNGIPAEKAFVAYPGIDFEEVASRAYRPTQDIRSEFGADDGQLLAAMVGNIRFWKGQHVVVSALAGLSREQRRKLRVLFVGQATDRSSEYRDRLDRAIREHELEDMILFTGRREDVPDLLEATDIAIHASVQPEPFGIVVQEAMIHGCATVAANEGGPAEMITPESGRMFNPDNPLELRDHLRELIANDELRRRLAAGAQKQARKFDITNHVELVERQYRRLLSI